MSKKGSFEEIEANLTLRDRINFTYILANQIMTLQKAISNVDYSEDEITESIEGLIRMVPESWRDEQFNKALEEATIKSSVDVRPSFCGVKATPEICEELGIPAFVEIESKDYHKLFEACINLFDRRGLLSKRVFTEIMLGERYVGEGPDLAKTKLQE